MKVLSSYKLPTPLEMSAMDSATIAAGTASQMLMERAAQAILQAALKSESISNQCAESVTVLCGPGNNGGDGLAIARLLAQETFCARPKLLRVVVAGATKYSVDFALQLESLLPLLRSSLFLFGESKESAVASLTPIGGPGLSALLSESTLLIDALLGTGQKEAARGCISEIIEIVGKSRHDGAKFSIVAVDIPSGINAQTGEVYTPSIASDLTVSVQLIKRGLLQEPARTACGELRQVEIGIDCSGPSTYYKICKETVVPLGPRGADFHKGKAGHVVVIGGSKDMPGAPVLSSISALRSGAGLVTKARLAGFTQGILIPEIMQTTIPSVHGFFEPSHVAQLQSLIVKADCLVLGPGMGNGDDTSRFVFQVFDILRAKSIPAVIDADALNILAQKLSQNRKIELPTAILTPHPGEMARLLKISVVDVQRDRFAAAQLLHERTGAVVVLKGPGTLVFWGNAGGINTSGTSWMATAGSGDVLCGIIAALIAQGLSLHDAACAGVLVHGLAGEGAHAKLGGPIIASDIVDQISPSISFLYN